MEKLSDYLHDRFLKWMAKQGRVKSQNEFAKWLGVSSGSLSQWMNDMRLPVGDNIHALAEKLGPEVYDILGEPRSMPKDATLEFIAANWHLLNKDQQSYIKEVAKDMVENKQGIPP
jgi:transcriptional regulator with XRE-family HTH domain